MLEAACPLQAYRACECPSGHRIFDHAEAKLPKQGDSFRIGSRSTLTEKSPECANQQHNGRKHSQDAQFVDDTPRRLRGPYQQPVGDRSLARNGQAARYGYDFRPPGDRSEEQSFRGSASTLIARRSLRTSATDLDSECSRSAMADAVRHSARCNNMNTVAKKIAAR